MPITTSTTAAANLLLILIIQVPVTTLPPPSLLSPFNFSYIEVTPPRTTTGSYADSDTVIPASSALAIKTVSYDDSGTAIIPTTLLERTISYSLLSLYLLIPSQLIKLLYGDNHYCTVLKSKRRLAPIPSSIPSTATNTGVV